MKKTPFSAITDICYNIISEQKQDAIYKYSEMDKILVWIVGFAITGFSLIISNKIDFSRQFQKDVIVIILSFLFLSIICGILYRISSFFAISHFQQLIFKLKGSFMSDEMMNTEPLNKNIDNITYINNEILINYGHNYEDIVKRYFIAENEKEKKLLINYLINEHNELASIAKKDEEYSTEYVYSTYKRIFGLNNKQFQLIEKTNNTFWFKFWEKFRLWSLLLTLISFIIVLLILFFGFTINYY